MAERKPPLAKEQEQRVRRERLAELKVKIENGTYNVDAQALSRKIVDAHVVPCPKQSDT